MREEICKTFGHVGRMIDLVRDLVDTLWVEDREFKHQNPSHNIPESPTKLF